MNNLVVKKYLDDEEFSYSHTKRPTSRTSTLYRLEIGTMELFSVYGNQARLLFFISVPKIYNSINLKNQNCCLILMELEHQNKTSLCDLV
jgi:hypothetical protein